MKMKIGDMAKLADCPVVTIRFYEKKGLLRSPERSGANYRLYSTEDAERLRFILHCRRHGIKIADIRALLALKDKKGASCKFAHEMLARYIADVQRQIDSLRLLKSEMENLAGSGQCQGEDCAILQGLSSYDGCGFCCHVQGKQSHAEN